MLTADSDAEQKMVPIGVRSLSVGPSGQCAAVLDAPTMGDETRRNVFLWGNNEPGQLGNGKRSSLAAPVILTAGDKTSAASSPARDSLILVGASGMMAADRRIACCSSRVRARTRRPTVRMARDDSAHATSNRRSLREGMECLYSRALCRVIFDGYCGASGLI